MASSYRGECCSSAVFFFLFVVVCFVLLGGWSECLGGASIAGQNKHAASFFFRFRGTAIATPKNLLEEKNLLVYTAIYLSLIHI